MFLKRPPDPKAGDFYFSLLKTTKSASTFLCCSRYLLEKQLFRERGPCSEYMHVDWEELPECNSTKFYFTCSAQKYLQFQTFIYTLMNNELMLLWKIHSSMCNDFHVFCKMASDCRKPFEEIRDIMRTWIEICLGTCSTCTRNGWLLMPFLV